MAKGEVWRRVVCLHIATAVPAISFTVEPRQCVIPFAGSFVATATGLEIPLTGLFVGMLIGSYTLGRAAATPFWLWAVKFCGQQAALQICLLTQFVLTLCFGLSTTITTVVILRFFMGVFSPGYALARDILITQIVKNNEDVPTLGVFSLCTQVFMQAAGLILGATVVQKWDLPYLEVCLVDVIIVLFAFAVISTDFPENPVMLRAAPRQQGGKFAKFQEEVISSTAQELPVDVPSYLAHFTQSDFPKLTVLKDVFTPNTTDTNHGDNTIDSEVRDAGNSLEVDSDVKRVHISFVEEEVTEAAPELTAAAKMDDPFAKTTPRGTLNTSGFRFGIGLYTWVVFVVTTIEYSGLFWLMTELVEDDGSPRKLGLMLAGSTILVAVLEPIVMSGAAASHRLNKVATLGLLVAAFAGSALPFAASGRPLTWTLPALVLLLTARNCGSQLCLTIMVLRLGESVSMDVRNRGLKWADWLGCSAKGAGIVCGPLLMSIGFRLLPMLVHIFSGASAALYLFSALLVWTSAPKYPRLSQAPYCM